MQYIIILSKITTKNISDSLRYMSLVPLKLDKITTEKKSRKGRRKVV